MGRLHRSAHRTDSCRDRVSQTIFVNQFQSNNQETEFLRAAELGHLEAVKHYCENENINVNCQDYLGRGALELAVASEHYTIIQYLLERCNLLQIEDALIGAIEKDNVRICELILKHPAYKSFRVFRSNADHRFYHNDSERPRYAPESTPIQLACHKNNYHIIQLLIMRGACVEEPHDYFCVCSECQNQRTYDIVRYSRSRLNTFRALASSAYISLSSGDPISTAFELSHHLDGLASIEKEYKSEYIKLSEQCKNYAVDLLELCRDTNEVMAVLNEGGDGDLSLARVKLAIEYEQKRFLAHAACQRELIMLWYSGVPWLRHQNIFIKLLSVPTTVVCLPIMTVIYIFAPFSKAARVIASPFVKFMTHTCSYLMFLILLVCMTVRSKDLTIKLACRGMSSSYFLDITICSLLSIWIVGMLWNEIMQLWRNGLRDYLSDSWNLVDSALISLFLAVIALTVIFLVKISLMTEGIPGCDSLAGLSCSDVRCQLDAMTQQCGQNGTYQRCLHLDNVISSQVDVPGPPDPLQLCDILLAFASLLSFGRIAYLLPANEQLGPLLVSFGRMVADVSRFLAIFLLVFIAFVCGMTNLYSTHSCENDYFTTFFNSVSNLFWATFGMGKSSATDINKRIMATNPDLISTHTSHLSATEIIGQTMHSMYIISALVVLINMLIAMMSNSFQEIFNDRDVEWKFARARLWMAYFDPGVTIPAPFNLLPAPKNGFRILKWIIRNVRNLLRKQNERRQYEVSPQGNGTTSVSMENIQHDGTLPNTSTKTFYQEVICRLVKRYIYKIYSNEIQQSQQQQEIYEIKQELQELSKKIKHLTATCRNPRGQRWPSPNNLRKFCPEVLNLNRGALSEDITAEEHTGQFGPDFGFI
ncbi:short transient receptor potential channel 7-like [Tubulanus polymorphus]|uniref:short transient receptor potential channel 7-like n=1 Tax=Tubulanus polymorphus TaxID=672921 RepID=UPI003DA5BBE7